MTPCELPGAIVEKQTADALAIAARLQPLERPWRRASLPEEAMVAGMRNMARRWHAFA